MSKSSNKELFLEQAKQLLINKGFQVDETRLSNKALENVFFVVDSSNIKLAVKAISLNNFNEREEIIPQLLYEASNEASMLSSLKHLNIVKYHSHFQEGSIFFIIMERAEKTLDDYIKQHFIDQNITEEEFFSFAGQLIDGIQFLHKKGIIIKIFNPRNVLVFPNNVLKLSNFEFSKRFTPLIDSDEKKQCQAQNIFMFFPPEIIQTLNPSSLEQEQLNICSINQTKKGDIWALGISLLNLLGVKPFILISLSCGYKEYQDQPNVSIKINQFLRYLIRKNPIDRPTIGNLRKMLSNLHPRYKSNLFIKKAILKRDKELDFEEAEKLLKGAIIIDPTNSRAYSHLALSLYRRNDSSLFPKVKEYLNKSLLMDPNNEDAIIFSSLEIITEDEQIQEELRQKALSINNQNPFVLNWIGSDQKEKNNLEEAERFFKLAIQADENYGKAYYNMGNIYEKKKEFIEAIDWHRRGIGRDLSDVFFIPDIANIFIYNLNQRSIGEPYLKLAAQSKCNYSKSEYGKLLLDDDNYEDALPYFQEVVKKCPGNSSYRFLLGKTLYCLSKYEEAEDQMRLSISIQVDIDNLLYLGLITGNQGKKEECISSFEEVISLYPNNAILHSCYAGYLEEFGLLNEALAQYEKSEKLEHDEICNERIEVIKTRLKS